jgi:hypothetical protein
MLLLRFAAGMVLNRVHNLFRGRLKAAVMRGMLRQDSVYFDQVLLIDCTSIRCY